MQDDGEVLQDFELFKRANDVAYFDELSF